MTEQDQPLVSVVLINHNGEKWIPETLSSLEAQTYRNLEFILVDDCSTDSSLPLFRDFAARNPNAQVFSTPSNLGISGARNLGIRAASGEFIAFLDSDDLFLPDTIQCYLDDFRRLLLLRKDLVMVMTDAWIVNERGEMHGRYMPSKYWGRDIVDEPPIWTLPSGWFVLHSKAVEFCECYRVGEANFYVARMKDSGTVAFVGRPGIQYRIRMHSVSNDRGADEIRSILASAETIREHRWDNPVLPTEVPAPSRRSVLAWTYGRSAKAAFVNRHLVRAAFFFATAAMGDFPTTFNKVRRFIVSRIWKRR